MELLTHEDPQLDHLEQYFKTVGLNHVTQKQLDSIIEKYGLIVFKLNCFSEVYKIVLERETSKEIHAWTILIGVMTVLYTIMTFFMYFK